MGANKTKSEPGDKGMGERFHHVRVWDLPTRIFHWLLVVLTAVSFITGNIGGMTMTLHERSGVAILVLVLFRMVWGFAGGRYSRFTAFIKGPSTVFGYAAAMFRKGAPRHIGHNPLGGWSIIAMLAVVLVQVGTGLFANDDILTEGPLYHWVTKETSDGLTSIHHFNRMILAGLVAVHVSAVLFHLFFKRENLITPMITGIKAWPERIESTAGSTWRALVITAIIGSAVYVMIY